MGSLEEDFLKQSESSWLWWAVHWVFWKPIRGASNEWLRGPIVCCSVLTVVEASSFVKKHCLVMTWLRCHSGLWKSHQIKYMRGNYSRCVPAGTGWAHAAYPQPTPKILYVLKCTDRVIRGLIRRLVFKNKDIWFRGRFRYGERDFISPYTDFLTLKGLTCSAVLFSCISHYSN